MFDVSVIIPTYNSANFIEQCVASVTQQNNVSFEIIIVDDKGTDDTAACIESLQEKHKNIRSILRPSPMGQATARNEGIQLASGKYVALLDSDDALASPDVLSGWVKAAEREEADITVAQFNSVSRKGEINPARRVEVRTGVTSVEEDGALANVTSCWQMLYRRSFLLEADVWFSTKLRQREDRLFVLQALLKANRVAVCDVVALNHIYRPGSSVTIMELDQIRQYNQHLTEYLEHLSEARQNRQVSSLFVDANTILYLLQMLRYWAPFLLKNLQNPTLKIPEEITLFLRTLKKMSSMSGIFYIYQGLNIDEKNVPVMVEGTLDVARLVLAQERWDLLLIILSRGRLAIAAVKDLLENSAEPWAEEACCRYLSFNRVARVQNAGSPEKLPRLVQKLVLHVGPPKTGSSALQNALERNRFKLIEQGFHYPVAGTNREAGIRRERVNGHARLIQSIVDGDTTFISQLVSEIESLQAPVHTLILSSENIVSSRFWQRGQIISAIRKALGIEQMEIVLVLREPQSWFRTYYREMCANPWNGFVLPPGACLETLTKGGLLDYRNIVDILENEVGEEALHLQFHQDFNQNQGILEWFTGKLGISRETWSEVRDWQHNRSVSDNLAAQMVLAKLSLTDRDNLAHLFTTALELDETVQNNFRLIDCRQNRVNLLYLEDTIATYNELSGNKPSAPAKTVQTKFSEPLTVNVSSEIFYEILKKARSKPVAVAERTEFSFLRGLLAKAESYKHLRGSVRIIRKIFRAIAWWRKKPAP